MTFFSQRTRRLEVVGAERARERETISRVVYKANCWDCQEFYIGKTKRRFNDRKTEHLLHLTSSNHSPAIAPSGGVLLGILDGGVPPGSPNPDPISDQKM